MGASRSRSADLRRKPFMSSINYIDSLQEVPGYFTKTQQVTDFLEDKREADRRMEMSYTGPPSHLQHSTDVHPFLDRFGPHFRPSEKYVDLSQQNNGRHVPPSLLPSSESARELREIEVRETMVKLNEQVKEVIVKATLRQETVDAGKKTELPTDEQDTLHFLDSIINESLVVDLDDSNDGAEPSSKDGNWIIRDRSKITLPGVVHSTVEQLPSPSAMPDSRPSSGFFRNSMYLPDVDSVRSPSSPDRVVPPPTKPKPFNRRSRHISDDVVVLRNKQVGLPDRQAFSYHEHSVSKNSSNTSTEDMGIVIDDFASEEGSKNGDGKFDTKSRVTGVRALVSMYNMEDTPPTEPKYYSFDPRRTPAGLQLPEKDYMLDDILEVKRTGKSSNMSGTLSSEDSALGDPRGSVGDVVLGVIHSELQKLRMNSL